MCIPRNYTSYIILTNILYVNKLSAHKLNFKGFRMKPTVKAFFDPATWTVTYVVYEATGSACAIIDSVMDYDPKSGRTRTASADKVIAFVKNNDLRVEWILETHAHADHLSAAPYLRKQLGGKIAIGAGITGVQKVFKGIFNLEQEFQPDGTQFDQLLADGETFVIGNLTAKAMSVPGHTPPASQ